MITFKEFVNEAYNFGATAYGNADIDKTTAAEIQKGILKPSWQYLGNRNNKLIPNYSVANNALPHGTIVKITDKRTGKPVGADFGNPEGIFRVDDTGGKNVTRNIDFYAGSDKNLYNYFARLGKDTSNLTVEPLNIKPGSAQEKQLLAKINTKAQGKAQQVAKTGTTASPSQATSQTPPQDIATADTSSVYSSPQQALGGFFGGLTKVAQAAGKT